MSYEIFRQDRRGPFGLGTKTTPICILEEGQKRRLRITPETRVTVSLKEGLQIESDGEPLRVIFSAEFNRPRVTTILDSSTPAIGTGRSKVFISPVGNEKRRLVLRGERKIPLVVGPEEVIGLAIEAMRQK